jgi:hypothetical protein
MTGNSLDSVVVDPIGTAAGLENFALNFPQTFNLLAPNLFFLCVQFYMHLGCGVLFFLGHETVNDLMMMMMMMMITLLMVSSSNRVVKCVMEPDILSFLRLRVSFH